MTEGAEKILYRIIHAYKMVPDYQRKLGFYFIVCESDYRFIEELRSEGWIKFMKLEGIFTGIVSVTLTAKGEDILTIDEL